MAAETRIEVMRGGQARVSRAVTSCRQSEAMPFTVEARNLKKIKIDEQSHDGTKTRTKSGEGGGGRAGQARANRAVTSCRQSETMPFTDEARNLKDHFQFRTELSGDRN
jgi:hypothetical protein